MTTIEDFVSLIRDELGLALGIEDVGAGLDEVPGWDSMNLLRLLVVLERETGVALSMPDVLQAPNLESIYSMAVRA